MSFDMDQDEKLKHFLQVHRPLAPPAMPQLENELLRRIRQSSPRNLATTLTWPWITGGVLLLTLVTGGFYFWRSPTQTAQEPNIEELEAFLQETWSGAIYLDGTDWQDPLALDSFDTYPQDWWLLNISALE
jgi:hypothetical protein